MGKRSRPPTLTTLARRLVRDERLFARGDRVLCACSGGPDSTALLHVLALLRPRLGHELAAAGVDHGLRAEAGSELDVAESLARVLGVPFERIRLAVAPGGNLQARARAQRHAALQEAAAAAGAAVIATGHTADDRAETFLLRLLRGAGPRGLAVMPPRAPPPIGQVPLVRPLLTARRSDVSAHLRRHGLAWAEDPTNADARFLRVRVRREVLPLLEELTPGIVAHLGHLADMLGAPGSGAAEHLPDLTRAQRLALERAVSQRRGGTCVRFRGGREMRVVFVNGNPVLLLDS